MLNDQDYELLSAYIDGALTEAEQTTLEQRLQADSALRRELDGLQETVNLIRALPPMQAPRNFTLTPRMVRPSRWLIFPTTTAFSALSAAAAVLLMAFGAVLLFSSQSAALPASNVQQVAAAPTEISATMMAEEQELSAASTTMELPAAPPQAAQGAADQAETTGNAADETAFSAESEGFIETEVLATEGAMMMYAAPHGTQAPIDPAQDAQTFMMPETMPAMGGAAAPGEDDLSLSADSAVAIASSLTATPGAARENLTATLMLPTASSTPTDTPTPTATSTPPPSPTATPVPKAPTPTIPANLLPIGAFIAGIVLLVIALVTTWIRRRR